MCHETHRGRVMGNPWYTARLLDRLGLVIKLLFILGRFDNLWITADFSHWVVVSERLLNGSAAGDDLMRACAERTKHIHARVGSPQSAQVNDPMRAEARAYLRAHEVAIVF